MQNVNQTWVCLGVESNVPWPTTETTIEHESHQLILRPETETNAPSIAFEYGTKGIDKASALLIIRRYLSALSWYEGNAIRETFYITGSGTVGIGKSPQWSIRTPTFDYPNLQIGTSPKQQLALALYREALGVNSIPYKFLGFTKIINIIADKSSEQKKWINLNFEKTKTKESKRIVLDLKSKGLDIGHHLYSSGRCATAHAFNSPVIDPDISEDLDRLSNELPLVKELAEIVIERELGVKSRKTIYTEHKYEVDVFRDILKKEIIKEIEDRVDRFLDKDELGFSLNIGLRNKPDYFGLSNLQIEDARMTQGCLFLKLTSAEDALKFTIGIDLAASRLQYNPYEGPEIRDNRSVDAARCIMSFYEFARGIAYSFCIFK